jgi:hypothetical protein
MFIHEAARVHHASWRGSDRMARSERSPHIVGLGFEVLQTNISGSVHDDTQIEEPLSHSTGTVFSQSDMCSRVYLPGIYEDFGELEAWLRIWNISVYVHRGTAR